MPIDGSPCGDRALEEAAEVVEHMRAHARLIASHGAEVVRRAGAVAHGETAEGTPPEEIVRRARDCDVVVMARRERHALERLLGHERSHRRRAA